MKQFRYPTNRYKLFLVDQSKFKNNSNDSQPVVYAEAYEINSDGSITFYQYQTVEKNDASERKLVRTPVLSYPSGKWEACVLLNDNNNYPVFSPQNPNKNNNANINTSAPSAFPLAKNNSSDNNNSENNISDSNSDTTDENDNSGNNSYNNNNSNNNNYSNNSNWSRNQSNMPGLAPNTEDFKKAKNDYLESTIKDYVKQSSLVKFEVDEFLKHINKDPKSRPLKISETDIEWTASNLIRDRLVLQRKFSKDDVQKILQLNLPDIMKRQWNGKMSTILQILRDREETKNVNAIDIAIWMVNNNFT